MGTLFAEVTENKLRADKRVTEQPVHNIASFLKTPPASFDSQNKYCKSELQAQAPRHRLQPNGAAIGRKDISQHQHGQEPEDSSEASHSVFLSRSSDHAMDQRPFLAPGRISNPAALF